MEFPLRFIPFKENSYLFIFPAFSFTLTPVYYYLRNVHKPQPTPENTTINCQCTEIAHLYNTSFLVPLIPIIFIFGLSLKHHASTNSPVAWLNLEAPFRTRFWIAIHILVLFVKLREGYCIIRVLGNLISGYYGWKFPREAPLWLVGVKAMGLSALLVILCLVSAVAVFLLMWSIYSIASLCQWHPEERDWDLKNGSVHEEDGGSVAARDEKLGRDKS